jgi:hypothetical protein
MSCHSLLSKRLSSTCYPPSPPYKSEKIMSYYPLSIQKAIQIYGSQPELLGLILSSKVEEDRRKTEEAKLRQKEIDYLLQQKEKKQSNLTSLHTPPTQSNRKTSIDMLLISPQNNQLKLPSPE